MPIESYKNQKSTPSAGKKVEKAPVTAGFLDLVAERFRILGEPMRLQLLHCLIEGEKTVGALVDATGATQANISRHLQTLSRAGILGRRKEGLHVYYHIEDDSVFELCDHVCGSLQRHLDAQSRALPGYRPKGRR